MWPRPLSAQQGPLPIIGVLDSAAATTLKLSRFYEGLKVEGFSRGQNLTVEYHSAEGDYARLPELAADLVNRRVTLITAFGGPVVQPRSPPNPRPQKSQSCLRLVQIQSRSVWLRASIIQGRM